MPATLLKEQRGLQLDKAAALYFPPSVIGSASGASCGKCVMYHQEKCAIVAGSINAKNGICGLYVRGTYDGPGVKAAISKAVAGYAENGPTHCGSCEYFHHGGDCDIVAGEVEYQGCCNFWERR